MHQSYLLVIALLGTFAAGAIPPAKFVDLGSWDSKTWSTQVDGVMGGKSSGQLKLSSAGAHFSGNINIHGGGFSSIRTRFAATDLSQHEGVWIELDMLNDGKTHAPIGLSLVLGDVNNGFADFAAAFAVPQGCPQSRGSTKKASVFIPFIDFTWHTWSRTACRQCRLDTKTIDSMSVYVLYQKGPFNVTIRKIHAVKSKSDIVGVLPTVPHAALSDTDVLSLIDSTINSGAFLYNKGLTQLCSAIYDMTARTLMHASGPSTGVKEVATNAIAHARTYSMNQHGKEVAWIHRRLFDVVKHSLHGTPPPPQSHYPRCAWGVWPNKGAATIKKADVGRSHGSVAKADANTTKNAGQTSESSSGDTVLVVAAVMVGGVFILAGIANLVYVKSRHSSAIAVAAPVQPISTPNTVSLAVVVDDHQMVVDDFGAPPSYEATPQAVLVHGGSHVPTGVVVLCSMGLSAAGGGAQPPPKGP